MKIKNLFLAATAIVVGMTSCSKDDGGKNETGEKNVYIKFEQPGGTRADVAPTSNGAVSTITYGLLYFATSSGDVKRYIRVDNSDITGTLRPSALEAGTVIESLSNDVSEVYFYANMFGQADKWVANISTLKSEIVYLAEQYADDHSIADAAMKGSGTLVPSSKTGIEQETSFEVVPMIARIEIVQLESDGTEGPSAAELKGIYVNNYHPDFKVGNEPASGVINHQRDHTKYYRVSAGVYTPMSMKKICLMMSRRQS